MDDRKLAIYLNDHLAGAVAGIELAKRSAGNNRRTPVGMYLVTFVEESEADRRVLEQVMERVGARPDRLKVAAGWAVEKIGRLKMNGQLVGYSDLSRLEEIESLCIGLEARIGLWRSLGKLAESDGRLASFDFGQLEDRARKQRATLEGYRVDAAAQAFAA